MYSEYALMRAIDIEGSYKLLSRLPDVEPCMEPSQVGEPTIDLNVDKTWCVNELYRITEIEKGECPGALEMAISIL